MAQSAAPACGTFGVVSVRVEDFGESFQFGVGRDRLGVVHDL